MELAALFLLINIAIIKRGYFGSIMIYVFNLSSDMIENQQEFPFIFGMIHGWLLTSLLLLQYLYKMGLIEQAYKIIPTTKNSSYIVGYFIGVSIEIKGVMFLIKELHGRYTSVFLLLACNTHLLCYII